MKVLTILVLLVAVGIVAFRVGRGSGSTRIVQVPVQPTAVEAATRAATQAAPVQSLAQVATSAPSQPPLPAATTPAPPTQAPSLDTPPGTVLQVGQIWRTGLTELILVTADFDNDGASISCKFKLVNQGATTKVIRVILNSFSATDDSGNSLPIDNYDWIRGEVNPVSSWEFTLRNKGDAGFIPDDGYQHIRVKAKLSNPSLTGIVVTVASASEITTARWRIPIDH